MVEDPRQGVLDALVLSQRCRAMRTNSVSALQTTPSLTVADGPRSDTPHCPWSAFRFESTVAGVRVANQAGGHTVDEPITGSPG